MLLLNWNELKMNEQFKCDHFSAQFALGLSGESILNGINRVCDMIAWIEQYPWKSIWQTISSLFKLRKMEINAQSRRKNTARLSDGAHNVYEWHNSPATKWDERGTKEYEWWQRWKWNTSNSKLLIRSHIYTLKWYKLMLCWCSIYRCTIFDGYKHQIFL